MNDTFYVIGTLLGGTLLIGGLIIMSETYSNTGAALSFLLVTMGILFLIVSISKITTTKIGSIKKNCVKTKPIIQSLNNYRYKTKECVKYTSFIYTSDGWKELVE